MKRVKTCATRPKGLGKQNRQHLSDSAISRQPRRCRGAGNASGKRNIGNGGKAARWEQSGKFTQPGRRAPHHVEARPIS